MDRIAYICREIFEHPSISQRTIAEHMHLSVGSVNRLLSDAKDDKLILGPSSDGYTITKDGMTLLEKYRVDAAVILAAGFGSRFVPLTYETPKGLLEVLGEPMIERQIKQLLDVGISDITIIVGYLKEKFDYLIDKYGVKLLYNPEYADKNTLASVWHARSVFSGRNVYLLSSDNWMRDNMYHTYEPGAWYSAAHCDGDTKEWCLTFNKKEVITSVEVGGHDAWYMYGPVYMSREFSDMFLPALDSYYHRPGTEQFYWEQVYADMLSGEPFLSEYPVPEMCINRQRDNQVYEFENLEELRQFDTSYNDTSGSKAMALISSVFHVPESDIVGLRTLKAGMTNQSFLFIVDGHDYICRIPGPGTEKLIDRSQEHDNYEAVASLGITEHVIYFDAKTGYKISEYYEGSQNSNPRNWDEVAGCMKLLHRLHDAHLSVNHSFDIRERISFYEGLCLAGGEIPYTDYREVRTHMTELLDMLDDMHHVKTLCHIDSVADNFLFIPTDHGSDIRLIDWEYAGMADPLIDIAMCAIYSYYNKEETDRLIQLYFDAVSSNPADEDYRTIYAYMALGGLLWALWAIYKQQLGETFGEYTLIMYRYAKDYYKIVKNS